MKIIIVGAALAGPTAAARAREINEKAEIILLERNTRVSYAMTGLAHYLSGEVTLLDDLNREREDFFRDIYNIDVRPRTEVIHLDAKKHRITIETMGRREEMSYDKLIFASGAGSLRPLGAPKDAENFRYFRTLDDLEAIRASLDANRKRFVVLGASSMGLEALDGLVRGGAEVTLIEKKSGILPEYSRAITNLAHNSIAKKTRIITGFKEITFSQQDKNIHTVTVDGEQIKTDFVVSAIGVKPRTEILKKAGVKLLANGAIPIDEKCRTNIENIYACSICAAVPVGTEHYWIAQAALSDKTAQVAGENAAGGKARLVVASASQIIRLPDIEVGRVGIDRFGKNKVASVLVHASNIEPYMPAASPIALKLWYLKKNQQVVALEAVGHRIKARLDAMATAIQGKLKLKDLAMLDFAYTPSMGTARDALNIAATVALQQANGITGIVTIDTVRTQRKKYLVLDVSEKETQTEFHDLYIPLERLRSSHEVIQQKLKKTKAKTVALLSETGRRGHLAFRILQSFGFNVQNISGGKASL
ncbi:MAG TPA: FAD-dependent oxidoreductase [Turneriella sp.]|nr:FAD-dependent oxidoreductase [Turneriella sp.]